MAQVYLDLLDGWTRTAWETRSRLNQIGHEAAYHLKLEAKAYERSRDAFLDLLRAKTTA